MGRPRPRPAVLLAVAVLISASASCAGEAAPATTIPADVDSIMSEAASAMGSVTSVRFSFERRGAPVFIEVGGDLGDFLEFVAAEGRFAAPDSADALLTVKAGGFNTRIGALAIGGTIWLSFLGGGWQPAPASYQFDPASLFDPDQGFRQLFIDGLEDVVLLGSEERDGIATYHIRGTAGEERVEVITASLVKDQSVELDAWVDRATGEMVDAFFTTQVSQGTAEWTMTFREYGSEVTIDPPDLGE